jgi:hypothetical protein
MNDDKSRNLRIRAYHEAGHVLMGFRLGVRLDEAWCTDISKTTYNPGDYEAAPARARALMTLAGGVAEELILGQRSPGCCTEDLQSFAALDVETHRDRAQVQSELEAEIAAALTRAEMRAALIILAEWLQERGILSGSWAPELLYRKCPAVFASLKIRPPKPV